MYRLALLILFIIAVIQIINVYNKPTVIETNYEHMNPALLTHQYENLASKPGDNANINFYVKDNNRYSVDKKFNPTLVDPLTTDPGLPCAPQSSGSIYQTPGANNTYADMIWNKTSPRMVLQDNCLHCNDYKPSSTFNEPSGISSSLTSEFEGSLNFV